MLDVHLQAGSGERAHASGTGCSSRALWAALSEGQVALLVQSTDCSEHAVEQHTSSRVGKRPSARGTPQEPFTVGAAAPQSGRRRMAVTGCCSSSGGQSAENRACMGDPQAFSARVRGFKRAQAEDCSLATAGGHLQRMRLVPSRIGLAALQCSGLGLRTCWVAMHHACAGVLVSQCLSVSRGTLFGRVGGSSRRAQSHQGVAG